MKSFSKVDGLLATALAATLLFKIFVLRGDPPPDPDILTDRLQSVMEQAGYSARLQPNPPRGGVIHAKRDQCRLWVRDYDPYGTELADYEDQAAGQGSLSFVYQGQVYDKPPKLRPLMRFYFARDLARAGLPTSRAPILAVAASPYCKLDGIPWSNVAEVPW